MKTCTKCKEVKEITEFKKQKTGKNGIRSTCKICTKKDQRIWQKNNPDKEVEKNA